MTNVDIAFRYGTAPGETEMRAIDRLWEVYGIRRIRFDEAAHLIKVEYDATRLDKDVIAGLLRKAGIDVQETLAIA